MEFRVCINGADVFLISTTPDRKCFSCMVFEQVTYLAVKGF